MYGTGYLRILLQRTLLSVLLKVYSLGAHFLVPDFDCSDCSFFLFLLWAAISAFHSLAVPPSIIVFSLCLVNKCCLLLLKTEHVKNKENILEQSRTMNSPAISFFLKIHVTFVAE